MSEHQFDMMQYDSAATNEIAVSVGEVPEDAQITVTDTGWSEDQKERMWSFRYDGLDMIRAWYS